MQWDACFLFLLLHTILILPHTCSGFLCSGAYSGCPFVHVLLLPSVALAELAVNVMRYLFCVCCCFSMLFLSLYHVCPTYSDRPFPCVLLLSVTSLTGLATKVNPIQRIAMTHECLCVFYLYSLCCSALNPFQMIATTHECLCVLYFSTCSVPQKILSKGLQ